MNLPVDKLPNDNLLVRPIHTAVKGRARYKVKGLHQEEALKKYLECKLSEEDGIAQVRANHVTGNVLVIFHSDISTNAIALLLQGIILDYRKEVGKLSIKTVESGTALEKAKNLTINQQKLDRQKACDREQEITPWHVWSVDSVITEFNTSPVSGLSSVSAREKLKQYGLNVLPQTTYRSKLSILLEQFKSLPVAFLTVAAGLSLATGGLADAAVILGVVVTNAVIGYATESQSEKIINKTSVNKSSALVIRDSNLQEIDAQKVVAGDILVLKLGNYVAADARLIEANRLSIDESALFGKNLPVVKTSETLTVQDIPLDRRVNMVYKGTVVTGGQGVAVVVATGEDTLRSKSQAILSQTSTRQQLVRVTGQRVLISGVIGTLVLGTLLLHKYGLDAKILLAIQKLHAPISDRIMLGITYLGEPGALLLICLGLGMGPLFDNRRPQATTLAMAALSSFSLNYWLKMLFGRARPELWNRIIDVSLHSFPSGHAMMSTVIYGFLSYMLAKQFPKWRRQIFISAAVLIAAIGFSRLYLGVHWPTDVVAGYAAGLMWLIVCILILEMQQQYRSLPEAG
ncbi:phosphatase PAP2 family protein [Pleurocapsales cyanobacterium LEGE 06147]|nr:phosphatase PAP2 family protein [Pleurocapsales cyanobacterium LEGE 06147]